MDKRKPGHDNGTVPSWPTCRWAKFSRTPISRARTSIRTNSPRSAPVSRSHGILQPLVVRQVGDQYQLVAGERRLRAAQAAGLEIVPVRIVDFNDQEVIEAALAENIQRTDLNPIEKAQGFKDYLDRFSVNHEQLAQRLGLARSTITNLVNLLELAPEVQEGVRVNQISEAHAKILKGIKNRERQVALFKQIVATGLSVKALETLLREQKDRNLFRRPSKPAPAGDERPLTSAAWRTSSANACRPRSRFACAARTRGKS